MILGVMQSDEVIKRTSIDGEEKMMKVCQLGHATLTGRGEEEKPGKEMNRSHSKEEGKQRWSPGSQGTKALCESG